MAERKPKKTDGLAETPAQEAAAEEATAEEAAAQVKPKRARKAAEEARPDELVSEEARPGWPIAEEAVAEAEPDTGEAPVELRPATEAAPAPARPEPKQKRQPKPGVERRARLQPKREKPKARKPIVRLPKPEPVRGRRQERRGVVVSNAMDRTIVVKVDTIKLHPRYKKVVRRSKTFHAHDEQNAAKVGDLVRIVETRPLSRTKRWRLAEIVEAAR